MFKSKRIAARFQEDAAFYAEWARDELLQGQVQKAKSNQKIAAYYAQLAREEMNIDA